MEDKNFVAATDSIIARKINRKVIITVAQIGQLFFLISFMLFLCYSYDKAYTVFILIKKRCFF